MRDCCSQRRVSHRIGVNRKAAGDDYRALASLIHDTPALGVERASPVALRQKSRDVVTYDDPEPSVPDEVRARAQVGGVIIWELGAETGGSCRLCRNSHVDTNNQRFLIRRCTVDDAAATASLAARLH